MNRMICETIADHVSQTHLENAACELIGVQITPKKIEDALQKHGVSMDRKRDVMRIVNEQNCERGCAG